MLSKITIITYGLVTLKYLLLMKKPNNRGIRTSLDNAVLMYLSFINTGASTDLSRHEAKN